MGLCILQIFIRGISFKTWNKCKKGSIFHFILVAILSILILSNENRKHNKNNKKQCVSIAAIEPPPEIFRFFTLPLEIPDKTRPHPSKSKIVLHPLEILRPKTITPLDENSTGFFITPGTETSCFSLPKGPSTINFCSNYQQTCCYLLKPLSPILLTAYQDFFNKSNFRLTIMVNPSCFQPSKFESIY